VGIQKYCDCKYIFKPVPIIPKAALEECLPDLLIVFDRMDCDSFLSSFEKRLSTGAIYVYKVKGMGSFITWFYSAFEAFTWCHENYPEELRKKFKEVIA
jgi:hypothetical protein